MFDRSGTALKALLTLSLALVLLNGCGKEKGGEPGSQKLPQEPAPRTEDALPTAGVYNNAELAPVFKMISGATASLDIEIYQMSDLDIHDAIRAALARKVLVRVVKDPTPLGDKCNMFAPEDQKDSKSCKDEKKLKHEIESAGGSYVAFNKVGLCADPKKPCFEHGKMVIADRKVAMVSTGNFNSTNLCNLARNPSVCNRDYSVVVREPDVVGFLGSVFDKDLQATPYPLKEMLDGSGLAERVTVSPYSLEPLVSFIRSAKTSIRVQNQYLYETTMNQALMDAARRGVRVEITVASVCSFGPPKPQDAEQDRKLFSGFEAAGISLRLFPSQFKINGKPGYLHAKAIVVDDTRAWVGSVNGSFSATANNREFGVFFSTPEWVSSLDRVIQGDFASEDMETWQESLDCAKDRNSGPED